MGSLVHSVFRTPWRAVGTSGEGRAGWDETRFGGPAGVASWAGCLGAVSDWGHRSSGEKPLGNSPKFLAGDRSHSSQCKGASVSGLRGRWEPLAFVREVQEGLFEEEV